MCAQSDNDGFISKEEFEHLISAQSHGIEMSEINEMWRETISEMDENGDGLVCFVCCTIVTIFAVLCPASTSCPRTDVKAERTCCSPNCCKCAPFTVATLLQQHLRCTHCSDTYEMC